MKCKNGHEITIWHPEIRKDGNFIIPEKCEVCGDRNGVRMIRDAVLENFNKYKHASKKTKRLELQYTLWEFLVVICFFGGMAFLPMLFSPSWPGYMIPLVMATLIHLVFGKKARNKYFASFDDDKDAFVAIEAKFLDPAELRNL